jgi:hypothetical protein
MDLTKYNSKASGTGPGGVPINTMRSASMGFGGFSTQYNTKSSPRGYSPRDGIAMSLNNRSVLTNQSKFKEFALMNTNLQF